MTTPVLPVPAYTPRDLFDAAVAAVRRAAQPPKGISAQLLGEEYVGPMAFRVVLGYYRWHIQVEVGRHPDQRGLFHVVTVRASYREASAATSTVGRVLHSWKPLASVEFNDELATEQAIVNFLGHVALQFEHLDEFTDWVLKRRPF